MQCTSSQGPCSKLRPYSILVVWDEQQLVEYFYLPGHARKMAGRMLIRLHNEPDTQVASVSHVIQWQGVLFCFLAKKKKNSDKFQEIKILSLWKWLAFVFQFFCFFTFQFDDITCSPSDIPMLKKRTERNTCKPPGYSPSIVAHAVKTNAKSIDYNWGAYIYSKLHLTSSYGCLWNMQKPWCCTGSINSHTQSTITRLKYCLINFLVCG